MYAFNNGRPASLNADDIAAIRALFGPNTRTLPVWPDSTSLGNLTGLTSVRTLSGRVRRPMDETDNFRFTLTGTRKLRFELRGLTHDVHLFLNDRSGRLIAWSQNSGTSSEFIERTLEAGTYYVTVDVSYSAKVTASYQLRYGGEARGTTRETAFDWRDLTDQTQLFLGFISVELESDTVDRAANRRAFYRFTLRETRNLQFELYGLTANADLYLESATGQVLRSSTRSGTAVDSVVRELGAGTYYLRVDAVASGTIRYGLRYGRVAESGDTRETAAPLGDLTDAAQYRTLSGTVDDIDPLREEFYRFTLSATRVIRIELRGLTADAHLSLEQPTGLGIASSTRSGTADESIVRTLSAGTYDVRVVGARGTSGPIGFQLRYRAEGIGGTTRATAVFLGDLTNATSYGTRTGLLDGELNHEDFYRFTLSASRRIRIELRGLSAGADLFLLNSSGVRITSSERGGTAMDSIVRTLEPGIYYLRVDAAGAGTIDYQLRYRAEVARAASGSTRETAWNTGDLTAVSAYRTKSGTVNRSGNDDDYRRFTLTRTRQVQLELRNLSADANLFLESASGQVLQSSRRAGTANETLVRVLGAGTWYIRVDANAPGTIRYQLRYRTERPPAPGTTRQTAWSIGDLTHAAAYRTRSGTVNRTSNDDDYRRFTLTRTRRAWFELRNLSADANLFLESAYGQVLLSSRSSGTSSETAVLVLNAGTYHVRVDANAPGTIRYQLRYRTERAPDPGTARETAWYLGDLTNLSGYRTRSGTVNGTSNPDDFRRFTLTATRTMRFELRNLSADADLYLENALGAQVAASRLAGTSVDSIVHTLGAGTWYIRVGAYGFGTIRYQLRYGRSAGSSLRADSRAGAPATSGQPLWRDNPLAVGGALWQGEREGLERASGMLSV